MKPIDYLRLQAKRLFKDSKTKRPYVGGVGDDSYYEYDSKYFDVDGILLDYDWDESKFSSLMKTQHSFAQMLGFRKWEDLARASDTELELTKLLFDNQHKISVEEWKDYASQVEYDNKITLKSDDKLEIFKKVFANVDGHQSYHSDYRILKHKAKV